MNNNDICFVMIYSRKSNKYTTNILTAAIETYAKFVNLYLVDIDKGYEQLQYLSSLNDRCRKIVVGITFMTMQIDMVLDVMHRLKRILSKALFIAGGPHATGDPYGTLLKLGFDIVVYGEGEATIIELLSSLRDERDPRVCGTAYFDDDYLIIKMRPPINLNLYPPFPFWRNVFNPIEIMRGCYASCYFCQVTYMFGLPRYRDIDNVMYYSKIMLERGLKDLRFISPNSFGYGSKDGISPAPDQLLSLLTNLRALANNYNGRIFFGTFPSEVRPDSVTEEIAREVRKLVDNRSIIVGVQSGSKKILNRIHRRHSTEDAIRAVDILTKSGFQVDVDLILGFEFEDDEDVEDTMRLASKLVELGARIHLHTFIPLPGTPLFLSRSKPLRKDVEKFFKKLIGEGKAYGYWIQQEKISQYIEMLKSNKLVYDISAYRDRLKITKCC